MQNIYVSLTPVLLLFQILQPPKTSLPMSWQESQLQSAFINCCKFYEDDGHYPSMNSIYLHRVHMQKK